MVIIWVKIQRLNHELREELEEEDLDPEGDDGGIDEDLVALG